MHLHRLIIGLSALAPKGTADFKNLAKNGIIAIVHHQDR
ncbi:hypothetical protein CJJ8425_0069 [Campylobacter jejuni subsp. jejuni 84-25]|nr:hypothetical protein CJJ8425_0069 [Campylobacter jejuni subsp. jejuni 84-25]